MYDPEKVRFKNIESEYDYWAEEAKYLNAHYNRAKAHAKPDICIQEAGWEVFQTYAYMHGTYSTYWSKDGRVRLHATGRYKTEEQLREETREMDDFIRFLEKASEERENEDPSMQLRQR